MMNKENRTKLDVGTVKLRPCLDDYEIVIYTKTAFRPVSCHNSRGFSEVFTELKMSKFVAQKPESYGTENKIKEKRLINFILSSSS